MPVLRFLGHSACEVHAGDARVLIDPFLTGNPVAATRADDLSPTAILLTHAHNDHVGDAVAIARRCGAQVVAIYELAQWLGRRGVNAHPMSLGGAHQFDWGWVKMTPAWHGSTWEDGEGGLLALGTPGGFVLRAGGKTLYHAGDTALFGDMALIGRLGLDLALVPIGDNFTMGPDDALEAVKLLNPRVVVPIHYDTFPLIAQDAGAWAARVGAETGSRCVVLRPGESTEY